MSAIPKKRPIVKKQELENSLRNIYGQTSTEEMSHLDYKKTSRLTKFLWRFIGFLFLLTIVSWGGFLWWRANPTAPGKPLVISLETQEKITSGAENCFKVLYENIGRVPIASLSISLNLPESFQIKETKPAVTSGNEWILSPLAAGSDGVIDVCGTFRSTVLGTEKIQAVFTYRSANFNSDFQDIVGANIVVDRSVVSLTAAGPTEAVVGDPVSYEIKIKNTGTEKIENIRLRPILPEVFTLTSSNPNFSETDSTFWNIASLETEAEQTFILTGSFTSSASGIIPMIFESGFLDSDNTFIKQGENKVETNVVGGELNFGLIINGSTKDQTINPGGRLRLSLNYNNQGQETLTGVNFTIEAQTDGRTLPIDFSLSDLADGVQNNNSINWGSKEIFALTSLAAAAAGNIDSVLVLNKTIDAALADVFTLQVKASINQIGSTVTTRTISSTPITIKINSDTSLAAEARYYDADGAPVGSGPLPPKVGETTTFRIFWTINNTLHDLKNLSTTMTMPAGVAWINNVQADTGSLTFNEITKQVSWKISTLLKTSSLITAWFDVAITPAEKDVGYFYTLANPTALETTDVFTNDLVHGSTDALTTALPNDSLAAGKGVVE
jgi:uncharacterized repeat protein (TIGR01451 family)